MLALLKPYFLLIPLGILCSIGISLQPLDAIQQISVPRLILFQHVLNDLNIFLLLLELIRSDVLIRLLHPCDSNQQQSLDEAFEDVEAVDGPKRVVVVYGRLQPE